MRPVVRAESPRITWPSYCRGLARRWIAGGTDLVFPPGCACCSVPLESSAVGMLCPRCVDEVQHAGPTCRRCAAPAPPGLPNDTCPRCQGQRFHFAGVASLGVYESTLRGAVLRVKQPAGRGLAMALGDLLAATCAETLRAWQPDAIVPVPMHWSRRLWRGANGPTTIAERIAWHLGAPVAPHVLSRRRRTVPQAALSRRRRAANVRGAFRATRHRDLAGARLLIVDDIMTTGATVNEAAKTLERAGADWVGVAVLARATGLV